MTLFTTANRQVNFEFRQSCSVPHLDKNRAVQGAGRAQSDWAQTGTASGKHDHGASEGGAVDDEGSSSMLSGTGGERLHS